MTAENHDGAVAQAGLCPASMRPRPMTAENLGVSRRTVQQAALQ